MVFYYVEVIFFSVLYVIKCIKFYFISVVYRFCIILMICWFNLIWLCMSIKVVFINKNILFVYVFLLEIIILYLIKY